jgi:hypothetical protein
VRRVGILLLLVVAAACGTSLAAFASQSPKALRASIFAAAGTRHSVHYVTVSVGPVRTRMVADVAADRGIQRIAFTKSGRTGHVTVIVVGKIAYVRGDAFALHNYMEFTKAQSSRYAGRWISIPPPRNEAVAAAVTFSSFLHELQSPKLRAVRVLTGKIGGQKVVGVRSTGKERGLRFVSSLFALRGSQPLPVREKDVVPTKGYASLVTMTRWNEPVRVHAPAHATPVS